MDKVAEICILYNILTFKEKKFKLYKVIYKNV